MNDHVLSSLLGRFRRSFAAVGAFSVFYNLLVLTLPIYMLSVFTRVLTAKSEETLLMLTIAATVALTMQALLDFIRSRLLIRVALSLDATLSPEVLESVLRTAAGTVQRNAQRMRDATELRNFLNSSAVFIVFDAPFVPFYVLVIYMLHPMLGTMALVGGVLLLSIAIVNELATRAPLQAATVFNRRGQGRVDEFVRNADVIAAMGMMPAVLEDWRARNTDSMYAMSRAGDRGTIATSVAKFVRVMLQIGLFGAGAYLYIHNEILPGAIIAASILMGRALAPIEAAIGTWRSIVSARGAHRRLKEILDPERLRRYRDRTSLPAPSGKLVVNRVILKAPGSDKMILKGVSFMLEPGEFIGIVGPSGAGKTTLGKLIVGILEPSAGVARLDGSDLANWNPDELGPHVGYLPQDVQLFSGTVRENIARLAPDGSASAVLEAARMAGVHETILSLPNGYDTDIGDAGGMLSAGQRQHIALARALFGAPKLLVLDEPNSNLDAMSERALLIALDQVKARGSTIVVITHRPSILDAADKLLVLKNGTVDAFGARGEVMARLTKGSPQNSRKRMTIVRGEEK